MLTVGSPIFEGFTFCWALVRAMPKEHFNSGAIGLRQKTMQEKDLRGLDYLFVQRKGQSFSLQNNILLSINSSQPGHHDL